jgi:hypothetical protein
MTPSELFLTVPLLGLFVLLGGCYGLFYSIGRLHRSRRLIVAAYLMYFLQALTTAVILASTPLSPFWKLFIVLSGLTYLMIPPLTWRYLQSLHHSMETPQ